MNDITPYTHIQWTKPIMQLLLFWPLRMMHLFCKYFLRGSLIVLMDLASSIPVPRISKVFKRFKLCSNYSNGIFIKLKTKKKIVSCKSPIIGSSTEIFCKVRSTDPILLHVYLCKTWTCYNSTELECLFSSQLCFHPFRP